MQIHKNAVCLLVTLGILLLANDSFARAQKPPSNGAMPTSNTSQSNTGGGSGGGSGKKYVFTFGGTTQEYTVEQLEALGPIKNADGTIWMNGPGTFPGVKKGEAISLQNFFNNTPTTNAAAEAVNSVASGGTPTAPAALPAQAQAFAAPASAPTPQPATTTKPPAAPAAPPSAASITPVPPASVPNPNAPTALTLNERGELCFKTLDEYNSIKDKLPPAFRTLPLILHTNTPANVGIKVLELNGKIQVQSAVWFWNDVKYGEAAMKEACFKGNEGKLVMEDGGTYGMNTANPGKVSVAVPGKPTAGLAIGSAADWTAKLQYIAGGAKEHKVTIPAFGVQ